MICLVPGTMCSGSECPVLVASLLAHNVRTKFGVNFAFVHKFGCERAPEKQSFLREIFSDSCPMLFKDVLDMTHCHAHDLVSGHDVQVPPCDILVAGFPCTDVSNLNKNRSTEAHRGVIENKAKSTGTCFHGITCYMEQHRPRLVILENVMGLAFAGNNLAQCISRLEEVGYTVKVWGLSPLLFAIPQERRRVWMVAINKELLLTMGASVETVHESLSKIMRALVHHGEVMNLDRFLLAEEDPLIKNFYASSKNQSGTSRATSGYSSESSWAGKWLLQNVNKCDEDKTAWWEHTVLPSESFSLAFPGMKMLNERHWDCLQSMGLREEGLPEESPPRIIDLSQTIERAGRNKDRGISSAITPKGFFFNTQLCRPHHGMEQLQLQGIYYSEKQHLVAQTAEGTLHDLAGNAFQGHCCLSVLLCALSTLAMHWEEHREQSVKAAENALTSSTQKDHPLANFSDSDEDTAGRG